MTQSNNKNFRSHLRAEKAALEKRQSDLGREAESTKHLVEKVDRLLASSALIEDDVKKFKARCNELCPLVHMGSPSLSTDVFSTLEALTPQFRFLFMSPISASLVKQVEDRLAAFKTEICAQAERVEVMREQIAAHAECINEIRKLRKMIDEFISYIQDD